MIAPIGIVRRPARFPSGKIERVQIVAQHDEPSPPDRELQEHHRRHRIQEVASACRASRRRIGAGIARGGSSRGSAVLGLRTSALVITGAWGGSNGELFLPYGWRAFEFFARAIVSTASPRAADADRRADCSGCSGHAFAAAEVAGRRYGPARVRHRPLRGRDRADSLGRGLLPGRGGGTAAAGLSDQERFQLADARDHVADRRVAAPGDGQGDFGRSGRGDDAGGVFRDGPRGVARPGRSGCVFAVGRDDVHRARAGVCHARALGGRADRPVASVLRAGAAEAGGVRRAGGAVCPRACSDPIAWWPHSWPRGSGGGARWRCGASVSRPTRRFSRSTS